MLLVLRPRAPFVIYFLIEAFGALAVIALARREGIRNAALLAFSTGLCLAFAEMFFFLIGQSGLRTRARPVYYQADANLGYSARPGAVSEVKEYHGAQLVYDVAYHFDPDGLRHIPRAVQGGPCTVAFFGGSFAFGHGLDDDQTVPYYFLKAARGSYRGFNFAFGGYGPHQMLRAIETGRVSRVVKRPDLVIYEAISDHVRRAAGQVYWDPSGPKYRLSATGTVRYAGPFHGKRYRDLLRLMRKSWLYRFVELHFAGAAHPEDVALLVAIVKRAQTILQDGDRSRFVALVWDNNRLGDLLARDLAQHRINVVRVSAIIPDLEQDPAKYEISAFDRHPSAEANHLIGEYLARREPKCPAAANSVSAERSSAAAAAQPSSASARGVAGAR